MGAFPVIAQVEPFLVTTSVQLIKPVRGAEATISMSTLNETLDVFLVACEPF